MAHQTLAVETIRYSTPVIEPCFDLGPDCTYTHGRQGGGMSLEGALALMRSGQLTAKNFPLIRVIAVRKGQGAKPALNSRGTNSAGGSKTVYFSLDNKRLWLFKQAGVKSVTVQIVQPRHHDTRRLFEGTAGTTIRFRSESDSAGSSSLPSLEIMVPTWALRSLLSEKSLGGNLTQLPSTFGSSTLGHYVQSFKPLVLEEARACLAGKLGALGGCPVWQANLRLKEQKPPQPGKLPKLPSLEIHTFRRARSAGGGGGGGSRDSVPRLAASGGTDRSQSNSLRSTDAVLISNFLPKSLDELQAAQQHGAVHATQGSEPRAFALAILRSTKDRQHDKFKAAIGKELAVHHMLNHGHGSGSSQRQQWFVTKLDTFATALRTVEAINTLQGDADKPQATLAVSPLLKEVLTAHEVQAYSSNGGHGSLSGMTATSQYDLCMQYCSTHALDASQSARVAEVASSLSLQGGACVKLLQGPPGTGKTTTLTRLLSVLAGLSARTLCSAPTNQAVCELACRYAAFVSDPSRQFTSYVQLSHPGSLSPGPAVRVCDLVLVANEDAVDVTADNIAQMHVRLRVGRLMETLGPHSRNWRYTLHDIKEATGDLPAALRKLVERKREHEYLKALADSHPSHPASSSSHHGQGSMNKGKKAGGKGKAGKGNKGGAAAGAGSSNSHGQGQGNKPVPKKKAGPPTVEEFLAACKTMLEQLRGCVKQLSHHCTALQQDVPSALLSESVRRQLQATGGELTSAKATLSQATPALLASTAHSLPQQQAGQQQQQQQQQLGKKKKGKAAAGGAAAAAVLASAGTSSSVAEASLSAAFKRLHDLAARLQSALPNILTHPNGATSVCEDHIEEMVLSHARHIFCTVAASGSPLLKKAGAVEVVLVDEAAQLVEAQTLILLNAFRSIKRLVLVGDPKQLPATVTSQAAEVLGYSRSMFERLQDAGHSATLLEVQYRMKPCISAFPSATFYDGRVRDGPNTCGLQYDLGFASAPEISPWGSLAFIDVQTTLEARGPGGLSYTNKGEVVVVAMLLERLGQARQRMGAVFGTRRLSVGVISPYNAQVSLLRSSLGPALSRLATNCCVDVEVKSVDSFQGSERDVIIFSAARNNENGAVGFLTDKRRLNVAITRPRWCLWLVGSAATLSSGDATWAALTAHMRTQGAMHMHEPPAGQQLSS